MINPGFGRGKNATRLLRREFMGHTSASLIAGLFIALSLQPENVGEVVDVIRHERETAIATGLEPSNESPKLKHSVELRFRHSAYLN